MEANMFKKHAYLMLGATMLTLFFTIVILSCVKVIKGDIRNKSILSSLETSKDTPFHNDYFVSFEKHVRLDKNLMFCRVGEECDNDKLETTALSSASGGVIGKYDGRYYAMSAAHFCIDDEEDLNDTGENGKTIELQKLIIVHFLNTATTGTIEKIDKTTDLCIISFYIEQDSKRKFKNIKLADEMPVIGEDIFTISAPLSIQGMGFRLHFQGKYGGCDPRYGCMYTIPATYGSSGSIVLNKKGELISILSIAIIPFEQIAAGPHVSEIRNFLLEFDKETGIMLY
tara:strand:- start:4223 stop:5077 length:855 start_codon:yes stop_codon:yes gene_type:complete